MRIAARGGSPFRAGRTRFHQGKPAILPPFTAVHLPPGANDDARIHRGHAVLGNVQVGDVAEARNWGGQETEDGEVIAAEELKRLGWDEKERPRRRKGDPQKVKLAGRLRRETTLSLKWIAQRLPMGSWTCVANLLNEESRPR